MAARVKICWRLDIDGLLRARCALSGFAQSLHVPHYM
jgi:hypothetical protein